MFDFMGGNDEIVVHSFTERKTISQGRGLLNINMLGCVCLTDSVIKHTYTEMFLNVIFTQFRW